MVPPLPGSRVVTADRKLRPPLRLAEAHAQSDIRGPGDEEVISHLRLSRRGRSRRHSEWGCPKPPPALGRGVGPPRGARTIRTFTTRTRSSTPQNSLLGRGAGSREAATSHLTWSCERTSQFAACAAGMEAIDSALASGVPVNNGAGKREPARPFRRRFR